MNYLETKKQILELKLKLVQLKIEKDEIIRRQLYEKAADHRELERKAITELEVIKDELLAKLHDLKKEYPELQKTHDLLDLLLEFNQDEMRQTYSSIKQEFMQHLRAQYEELWNERKQLHKEFRFREASKLQQLVIELGQFIIQNA
jgi:ferredoxin-NADP reductase